MCLLYQNADLLVLLHCISKGIYVFENARFKMWFTHVFAKPIRPTVIALQNDRMDTHGQCAIQLQRAGTEKCV